jgi:hypothetical protein
MSEKRSLLEIDEESGKRNCADHHQLLLDDVFFPAPPGVADDVDGEMEMETQQTNNTADGQPGDGIQCGQHSETIQRMRTVLTSIVDIQHGLLDELRALDVITHQQFDEIRSQRTPSSRVDQLLNIVVQMSDAQQEQFLTALQNNQQVHVSELIRAKGNRRVSNRGMRPALCCSEWRRLIKIG